MMSLFITFLARVCIVFKKFEIYWKKEEKARLFVKLALLSTKCEEEEGRNRLNPNNYLYKNYS